jgi:arylsulfatase A-like enzyme
MRLLAILVTLSLTASAFAVKPPRQPNIIVILADDLGWKDLGCYGSEVFETPNLDRMAERGIRFTSAYAASCVCSPTRASLMTGKHPARLDLTIWLGGRGGAPAVDHLSLDEITIAETLRDAGYMTAMVGKWHLGGQPYWPKQQGFDIAIGEPHGGSPAGGYYLPNRIHLPDAKQGDYLTDRLTDEAVKIIEDNHDRPFFLYQSYHSVHTPIQGRPDLVRKHQERSRHDGKLINTQYAAMVDSLDSGVGRIMDTLRQHDLVEHTVVIFTSDNGGYSHSRGKKNSVTDNTPLRYGKGYCYEGGHRVPWIVHYPPMVQGGAVSDEPVVTMDLYPTILQLAGLKPLPDQHRDGHDLSPLLADADAELDRAATHWHYPHTSPQGGTPSGAIRSGDWKLIEFFDDGRGELYNLKRDIGERRDLAKEMPHKAKELHDRLVAWRKRVDAKLPPPPLMLTKEFPGFDTLINVELKKTELGYRLGSKGNGLALRELTQPIIGKAVLELQIRPPNAFPSDGFLVFGEEPTDAATVKCGLLVGGKKLTAFNGAYPPAKSTQVRAVLNGGETYDVRVLVDLPHSKVTVECAGLEITHPLPTNLKKINYVGYAAIRTRAEFSEIMRSD